ncbi:DNA circularization protein [Desulfocurvibacter africanus]|uniref:DNA circulation family protein n=1 Tax=Desulfocurvibacter africanus subsp. africanus str. Walvis Bay TaxID=690850 RepID=F3Z2T8_DESAF|nr:DNA circularization N-terminal domain-containing protein [Desulfocurvibacter africanus]EGJ50255.1 DNA circulation family protein [Desulfocurvibacter africanus subsp. africanus str. Walvis Bay]
MAWKDQLKQASFRGVEFGVREADRSGGRRVAVHEYPQRDKPSVEDLGRKARKCSVSAFFVGEDCLVRSQALLDACEESGPGRLVLPWRAPFIAQPLDYRLRESNQEGRYVEISMEFVEAGDVEQPAVSQATQEQVITKSKSAVTKAKEWFQKTFGLDGLPTWALDAAWEQKNEILGLVDSTRTVVADAARYARSVSQLLDASGAEFAVLDLGQEIEGLISDLGDVRLRDSDLARNRLKEMLGLAKDAPDNDPEPSAPQAKASVQNTNAENDYLRALAAAEAARSSAEVEPETDEDAAGLRSEVLAALDGVLETTTDDDVYAAYADLRAAVSLDLSERGRLAPRVRRVTLQRSVPSLVLAWREREDLAAEEGIITRNRIRHPGALPAGEVLEVVDG